MAVNSTDDYAGPYAPDGVTTVFPFGFAALAADEVVALRLSDEGDQDILSGYTVTLGTNGGGAIVFALPPPVGDPLYVVSDPSFEQQADFGAQGSYSPKSLNKAVDRDAVRAIALRAAVSRSLMAPPTDQLGVLPSATERAGKFVAFDADGLAFASEGTGGGDMALRGDMASNIGFTLIKYKSSQANSYARSAAALAAVGGADDANIFHHIDPGLDPAIMDGSNTADLSTYIQNALNAIATQGGDKVIPNGATLRVLSNIVFPDNTGLRGTHPVRGRTFSVANLNTFPPRIVLSRAATMTINDTTRVKDFAVFADALTFNDTSANVNAWTGTAFTIGDNKADMLFEGLLIIGFQNAISTGANTRVDRPTIRDIHIDCVNGIYLKNCYDVPRVENVHGYPWSTLQGPPETNDAQLKRAGNFIQLDGGTNDQGMIVNCFEYGWAVGYRMTGPDNFTLLGCNADNPPGAADGSIGFLVEAGSAEGTIIAPKAAGVDTGMKFDTTDAMGTVLVDSPEIWETKTYAMQLVHGNVIVGGAAKMRNTGGVGTAIRVESTATKLKLPPTMLVTGFATGIDRQGSVPVIRGAIDFTGTTTPILNPYMPTVASAATLPLDGESENFVVTGTTAITAIANAAAYAGRAVRLQFAGAVTITNGANLKCAGGTNLSMTADDVVSFVSDGTVWRQASSVVAN
jgi:hypothetical protein